MKKIVGIVGLLICSAAFAGEPVHGVSQDLGEAIEKATIAVERAAAAKGTCVSQYPSLQTCEEAKPGWWQCTGIRANQGGSCGHKSADQQLLIDSLKKLPVLKAREVIAKGKL